MKLFECDIQTMSVTVSPEALLLSPFKALVRRDKKRDKSVAKAELAYVYFFADNKSDFQTQVDEDLRMHEISASLDLPDEWKPDKVVLEAIEFYKEQSMTLSMTLLKDSQNAVSRISNFLREVDPHLVDDKGKPIFDIKKIADTLKIIPALVKSLAELEEMVKKEVEDKTDRHKGSTEKAQFEDGL